MATEARPKRGRHAQWDEKTIKLAAKAVLVDHRSRKSVATELGIPRATQAQAAGLRTPNAV